MNEAEWLACDDPSPMLEFLRGKASERKSRLFAVACCHRIWQFITDPECRAMVELTEQAADGIIDEQRVLSLNYDWLTDNCGGPEEPFRMAFMVAGHVGYSLLNSIHGFPDAIYDVFDDAIHTSEGTVQVLALSFSEPEDKLARYYDSKELFAVAQQRKAKAEAASCERELGERIGQSCLLRDIFGNPFRPVAIDPAWLTLKMTTRAQAIYADRAFERMPELADALQATGCGQEDILSHCRGPGPHVRGCWVLDVLLGKG